MVDPTQPVSPIGRRLGAVEMGCPEGTVRLLSPFLDPRWCHHDLAGVPVTEAAGGRHAGQPEEPVTLLLFGPPA